MRMKIYHAILTLIVVFILYVEVLSQSSSHENGQYSLHTETSIFSINDTNGDTIIRSIDPSTGLPNNEQFFEFYTTNFIEWDVNKNVLKTWPITSKKSIKFRWLDAIITNETQELTPYISNTTLKSSQVIVDYTFSDSIDYPANATFIFSVWNQTGQITNDVHSIPSTVRPNVLKFGIDLANWDWQPNTHKLAWQFSLVVHSKTPLSENITLETLPDYIYTQFNSSTFMFEAYFERHILVNKTINHIFSTPDNPPVTLFEVSPGVYILFFYITFPVGKYNRPQYFSYDPNFYFSPFGLQNENEKEKGKGKTVVIAAVCVTGGVVLIIGAIILLFIIQPHWAQKVIPKNLRKTRETIKTTDFDRAKFSNNSPANEMPLVETAAPPKATGWSKAAKPPS